jgi:cytochrome bd-type quinol oxidase subunit 2
MRATHLANIALQAEKVRLQHRVKSYGKRAAMGAVGGVLAVIAIAYLHVAIYDALCLAVAPHWAALIITAVDLVMAVVFFMLASSGKPDAVEQEAIQVRDDAWNQIRSTMAVGLAMRPLARVLGRKHIYGLTLAALTARFLSRP